MKALKAAVFAIIGVVASIAAACSTGPAAASPQQQQAAGSLDGYRLGTGDEIKVTVFDEPDLSGAYIVDGQGAITMNLIDQIVVKNLTRSEAQALIQAKFKEGRYLRDPRVTVEMTKGRPYYITGEVNKAGEYPFTAGLTVINAIAAAGDFTYRADKKKIMVTGADGVEKEVVLTPITPIHPGDRIRVRERFF
jgi:protein involved in polysaccharide export with SLBB domain